MEFVDLARRFRDLTNEELEDPELLALFNERSYLSSDGWPELLTYLRVLLLAEAGSGKTAEMEEQAKRLRREGKPAFFIALEALAREDPVQLLSPEERKIFEAWKTDDHSIAWFFLDAVDELKLTQGKLDRALSRLASAADGLLHRMHVIISSRPADWRPSVDMATLQAKLPIVSPQQAAPFNPDEVFIKPLRKGEKGSESQDKESTSKTRARVVVLLPLDRKQIEIFSRALTVNDPPAFLSEINRRDAWTFARRPLDLSELVTYWNAHGRLGTRAEQHTANVLAKLRDDPYRPDRGVLSDAKARQGAERLALALALTRTRTLRSPEQALDTDRSEGVLDPVQILTDWNEAERQALLRRAIFDPATYGRVRFHHRSVQEYLAAQHLKTLRERGQTSAKNLLRLLFSERYSVPVVIPSMQPIAAWLALWDEDVRRELMKREPETLLYMGDPESLQLDVRAQLVRAFATAYGRGGWRGLNIPISEVRRLADPELAGVIRELWDSDPSNLEVRELLLEMIWQGSVSECADIARTVAHDLTSPSHHRSVAVRALIACRQTDMVREVADSLLNEPEKWPDQIVPGLAAELFPEFLTITDLVVLVERTREPRSTIGSFGWELQQIAGKIDPWSNAAVELRDRVSELIWKGRDEQQQLYRVSGRFDYLAPALARLCERQLSSMPGNLDEALIRACVVANRFGHDEVGQRELISKLKSQFDTNLPLREAAFWTEAALAEKIRPPDDAWDWYFRTEHEGLVQTRPADSPWLLKVLHDAGNPKRRNLALQALIQLWAYHGRVEDELSELFEAVSDNPELRDELARRTAPPKPDAEHEKWQRDERRHRIVREGRERQRLAGWEQWRSGLLSDPDAAFASVRVAQTVNNLYRWLQQNQTDHGRWNVWNFEALQRAFGPEIADRAATAFQATWRGNPAIVRSQRPPEERDSISWSWAEGLTGLAAETMKPNWASHLSPEDARIAAAYATIELNGFPGWLSELAAAHPAIVDEVIGGELSAELAGEREYMHLSVLQDLSHAEIDIKRLLSHRLLTAIQNWPSTFASDEEAARSGHHLDQALRILGDALVDEEDRKAVAEKCREAFSANPIGPLGLSWLRGFFRFDPGRATLAIRNGLESLPEPERVQHAIGIFASLFGDRDAVPLQFPDPKLRVEGLLPLVRIAYRYIRHEDDQKHEGVYTPDTRDDAERARGFLFGALVETPGPEAYSALLALADDPLFANLHDRLLFLARKRAASDADAAPVSPADVRALEKRFEAPPNDRDGLFALMMDRLEDLSHDVAHDDFTDRSVLRSIEDESNMQRTLARRLRDAARGAYTVTREDEVADRRRTDIRLAAVRGDQRAVIEVKIADNWSIEDFHRALRAQIVGQYLRHQTCKAGCLLLIYRGAKTYWQHPDTGARINFSDLVTYLAAEATRLERQHAYDFRLAVHGLDLTDPYLEPARR